MTKIIHFSDIHFNIPSIINYSEFFHPKRIAGGINYLLRRKNRYKNSSEKFISFLDFLENNKSDCNIFSGDLTSLGLKNELENGKLKLEEIKKISNNFLYIPGNHDLYIENKTYYNSFIEFHINSWPIVEIIDKIAIITINSSKPNPKIIDSNGHISKKQLEELKKILEKEEIKNKIKFLVTHYPLFDEEGNIPSFRRKLINDLKLLEIIKKENNLFYLHGHIHKNYHIYSEKYNLHTFCSGSLTYENRESFFQYEVNDNQIIVTSGYYKNNKYELDKTNKIEIKLI